MLPVLSYMHACAFIEHFNHAEANYMAARLSIDLITDISRMSNIRSALSRGRGSDDTRQWKVSLAVLDPSISEIWLTSTIS